MNSFVTNYIGRIVAFVLTPILLPIAGVVATWLQDALGLNLTGADLTAYVVSVIAGVALVVYKWLANRGEWEKAMALLHKVEHPGESV